MGLYVILEGTSSYNADIILNEITEEEFKEFDALMKSDKPFDLGDLSGGKSTPENTENKVKEAEKK